MKLQKEFNYFVFSITFYTFAIKTRYDMKRLFFVVGEILLMIGCETGSISNKLTEVDSLIMREEYDSAYQVLSSIEKTVIKDQEDIAYYNLLKVQSGYLVSKPLTSADSLLNEVIAYYQKKKNDDKLADGYYYKALGYCNDKDYKQSIHYFKEAELLANRSGNKHQQYKIAEGISFVNRMNNAYDLQLKYAKKAYSLAKSLDKKNWIAYSCYTVEFAYMNLGFEDSAYYYLQQIPQYIEYAKKSEKPVLLATLGYYLMDNHPDEAKQYFLESLEYKEFTATYINLANLCQEEKRYDEAYYYWMKALAVNDATPKDYIIQNLIEYDLERGKTDSISYMVTKIMAIRDSIDTQLRTDTIKDLQTRFDHEIALRKKDQIITKGILVASVVLFLLIAFYFRRRHLAKLQMLDYQMQINDNLRQIEILKASGTDTKQEVERLNKLIEDIMQNKVPKLDRGRMLYDDIINGNITMIDWNREHEQMFLDYYTATHYDTVQKMKNVKRVEKLTPHKLFYLILVKLGKTDEQIQQMMSVSDSTLRGLKHRTKPLV